MDVDRALAIARDPFATRHELAEVAATLADEVVQFHHDNGEHQRLQTLGGIPPAITSGWCSRA